MPLRGFNNLEIIDRSISTLLHNLTPQFIKKFAQAAPVAELYRLPWTDPVKETQEIARSILRYFGIKNSAVKVTFNPRLTVPGKIKIGMSDVFFVDLNAEYKNQRNVVIAILAHEVTHIFLHKHQIKFETTAEDEILTDTTAAFLGLGTSILNVAFIRKSRSGNRIKTEEFILGYISVDEFGYVIAKRDYYFGTAPQIRIEPGLPSEGYESGSRLVENIRSQRPFTERGLFDRLCWWIKSLFASKHADGDVPIVFDCQHCSQKLRIPSSRKTLQVKCSTCGAVQVCYS
jgi:predicted SprT family Zn-dependent metalloprotease